MKKLALTLIAVATAGLTGCQRDAQIASSNLSKAADQFEVNRRVVFYNGITGEYILTVEGLCSIGDSGHKVQITCKTGANEFKRHQLGLSDNVTYLAEHLNPTSVSTYHHRVVFKPQSIIPEIDLNVDADELLKNRH